jgi:ribosomal silencing factor RsfS
MQQHRELPTTEEVAEYLKSNGANDVMVVTLKEPLVNIKHMVLGSASSTRLIRQLAESICENVIAPKQTHFSIE